ncbi:hypothetical protein [Marinicella marina]|nr:hypothetical protein [Marinicella marina]
MKLLSSYGYDSSIQKLATTLSGNLWVVGGWVRNSALNYDYVGDVDCLTTLEPNELNQLLRSAKYEYDLNRFGTRRFLLPDGNHLDLNTTIEQANTSDIVIALKNFNFSINSAAINYSSGQLIYTESFARDFQEKKFHVTCEEKLRTGEYEVNVLKDMEVLEQYYCIKPVIDVVSNQLIKSRKALDENLRSISNKLALKRMSEHIEKLLPSGTSSWIVRGYPRCAYLGELRYWDDVDVIVDCSQEELTKHLSRSRINWSYNYFRTPKIFHFSGLTLDIWPLEKNQSIHEAISKFTHNLDSTAWPVGGDSLLAENIVLQSLDKRILSVNIPVIESMSKFDSSYAAIKSLYLIFRHNLDIDDSIAWLLNREFHDTSLMRKHVIRLVKELYICGILELSNKAEYIFSECGNNVPTSYMLKYWELPLRRKNC